MKRFLSFLTAVALVLAMAPAVSFAAEVRTVYLDPASGADTNNGLSEGSPVQTVEAAYTALVGADEGIVVFLSDLELTAEVTFPACSFPVTLTSQTGAEGIKTGNNVFFAGDTTMENMTLTLTASDNTYISSEGHDLTIGQNVTCVSSTTYRFSLTTKYGAGSNGNATLTVKSGNWRNIFVGGYKSATTGDATLIMTGGNVNNLVAPTYSGNITGNTTMDISGATIAAICAAANNTGVITGNVDITLGDGVSGKLRVKRLYMDSTVNGTATVTVDGDCSGITAIVHEGPGTGSITETKLVLKSGVLNVTPCEFDNVSLNVPQGETLTLQNCSVTADTVESAGTLVFSGSASLTAAAVTGSVSCEVSGDVVENYAYVTAPAGSGISFPEDTGITEDEGKWGKWTTFDESTFQGLVIRADKGVTVNLYSKYKSNTGEKQTPTHTAENGNQVSYYYAVESGAYRCVASQSGYYKLTKNIYMTAEEAATCTEHIVELEERAGGTATDSWEVSSYQVHTDELLALDAFDSDISQWPEYADVFTTPWFTETHAAQQQITQAQMEQFLTGMDDEDDNMYIFSMGKSGSYEHDVWVLFYTDVDLSSAITAEEAAAMMGQDKPTVIYRAQIHGNEPAAGEGALAIAQRLDGDYGESLIENINIVMIPRANPDGSQNFARALPSGVDANRDMLRVKSQEIADYLKLYQIVDPEMVIDGHEYDGSAGSSYFYDSDITAGAGFSENNTDAYTQLSIDLLHSVFDTATENGLTYRYYSNQLNSNNPNISRPYFGQQGCLSFLLETRGINTGFTSFERRVVTQVISVEKLLTCASENAQAMQQLVDAEKQYIVEKGKTYREEDKVYLSTAAVSDQNYSLDLKRIYQDGSETTVQVAPGIYNSVLRSRTAPTAYVIPAGESYTEDVLALMDKQDISYEFIPAGAQVYLQQYTGTTEEAALTEEGLVTFPNGAYVFCMNQVRGITLSTLMEPDVNDAASYSGTVAQQGLVAADENGYFPIYRYVRDLNDSGTIDYQIRTVEKTVYVSAATGSDENDGSEAAPVQTMETAYALITATEDVTHGNIILLDDYTLTSETVLEMPEHSYHVTITGVTADVVLTYAPTATEKHSRVWSFNGPTTIDNLVLHHAKDNQSSLVANGHTFVIGENVTTTAADSEYHLILVGGKYTESCTGADLTVLAGTWRNVYAGSYQGARTGDAKLTMKNCTVTNQLQNAYSGAASGALTIDLENVSAANIYCGNSGNNNVSGSVKLILRQGVNASAIYTGSKAAGNMTGTVTVVIDGADMTGLTISNSGGGTVNRGVLLVKSGTACAVTGFDEVNLDTSAGGTVKLATDMAFDNVTGGSGIVDLNGNDITGAITAQGEVLRVKDSQTDDYTVEDDYGYGCITGATQNVAAAEGYLLIAEESGVSFHKVDAKVESVYFSPTKAGIYYGSGFYCDEVVAANVESFGVALSITAAPTADENGIAGHCQYSAFTAQEFVPGSENEYTGTVLINILDADCGTATNKGRAQTDVYGSAYIKTKDGQYLFGSTVKCDLRQVVEWADDLWETLSETKKTAVLELYASFTVVMGNWDIPNIKNAAKG